MIEQEGLQRSSSDQEYGMNEVSTSQVWKAYSNILLSKNENFRKTVTEHITSIYDVRTPKEKIKKRPDGLDYIESTWMDKTFKEFSPLYEYTLLHVNESLGWIDIIVSLTDRSTGNTELGAGSARIQVRRGAAEPYKATDIVDKGNNLKAALTNACKNAQSKFGTGADVYGKREGTRSEEEKARFKLMLKDIKKISSTRAQMFEEQWNNLGVDFTEFLDLWSTYIDRNASVEDTSGGAKDPKLVNQGQANGAVTEGSLLNHNMSNVSNAKKKIEI
jgi:hypothetical protein